MATIEIVFSIRRIFFVKVMNMEAYLQSMEHVGIISSFPYGRYCNQYFLVIRDRHEKSALR